MNKKKLLALLMALVMTLTLVPVTALADDDPTVVSTSSEFQEAVENPDVSAIRLSSNISFSSGNLAVARDLDINLNGFTLTINSYTFTVNDGTLTLKGPGTYATQSAGLRVESTGNLVVNGAKVQGTSTVVILGNQSTQECTGTLTLQNGAVLTSSGSTIVSARKGSSVVVTDSTINGTGSSTTCIENNGTGTVTVNAGATLTGTTNAILNKGGGEVVVKGGSIQTTLDYNGSYATVKNENGTVTINGGTITYTYDTQMPDTYRPTRGAVVNNTTTANDKTTITGGTFYGKLYNKDGGTLAISGGTFDHDPTTYVVKGYKAVERTNEPGTWDVVPDTSVAQIYTNGEAGAKYDTLADAIAAANDPNAENVTIKLLANCAVGAPYSHSNPLTLTKAGAVLNLDGNTITLNENMAFIIRADNAIVENGYIAHGPDVKGNGILDHCRYGLVVDSCTGVVIDGITSDNGIAVGGDPDDGYTPNAGAANGVIMRNCNITGWGKTNNGDARFAVFAQNGSDVTIESGTYSAHSPNKSGVLYATKADDGGEGVIYVTGGSFRGVIHPGNNLQNVVISGGLFDIDPRTTAKDAKDKIVQGATIKTGYEVVSNTDAPYLYKVQAVTSDTMYPVDVLGYDGQGTWVSYYLYALSAREFGVGSTDAFTGTNISFANLNNVQKAIVEACYTFEGQDPSNITESKFTFRVPMTEGYTIDTAVTANGTELQSVIDSADDNSVITLDQDYVLSTPLTIPAGKTLTLDLSGHSITVTSDFKGFMLKNSGTLTLKDSGTGGKIDLSNAKIGTFNQAWGVIENSGMMTIKSGHITGKTFTAPKSLGIQNLENATLIIDGGTFDGNTRALNNWGTATIEGGTFDSKASPSTNWYMYTAGNIGANGRLTVNNATITGSHGALFVADGYLEVNDGNFTGGQYYGIYCAGEYGKIQAVINGGTFSSAVRSAGYIGNDNDGGIKAEASVVVNGGTFIPATNSTDAVSVATKTGKPIIFGGTFAGKITNLTKYIGTGYTAVQLGDTDAHKVENYTTYRVGEVQTTTGGTITPEAISNNTYTYTVSTNIVDSRDNEDVIKSLGVNPNITVSGTTETTYSAVETKTTGTSAVGAAALSQLKDADTIDKIVAAAVESAGSEAENASEISVVLVSDGGTQTKGDAQNPDKVTKITYEVHPEAIVYKTQGDDKIAIGSYAIKNEELGNTTFTFKLNVPNEVAAPGNKVIVNHKHADGTEYLGTYTVKNNRTITLENIDSFSEFELILATDANTLTTKSEGASLRRRVLTGTNTVVRHVTDMRFTFSWKLPGGPDDVTLDKDHSYFQWKTGDSTEWSTTMVPMEKCQNYYSNQTSSRNGSSSLVIEKIGAANFSTQIMVKLHLAYTQGGESKSVEIITPASRSVIDVATALASGTINNDPVDEEWVKYGKFLLHYADVPNLEIEE